MKINIVTLFPEMFDGTLGHSIIKRAIKEDILTIERINPRDFTDDKHNTVDDYPFGGGPGMVLKPEPIFKAVKSIPVISENKRIVLLCPSGIPFSQKKSERISQV